MYYRKNCFQGVLKDMKFLLQKNDASAVQYNASSCKIEVIDVQYNEMTYE
jgi:hypothetical protein